LVFSWAGDGGLLAFFGPNHQERALLAGVRLIYSLPVFNLDPGQNEIGEPIAVRQAANEALVVFQRPPHSITSAEINLTVHLQEKFTSPGEFCATDTILSQVRQELRDRFNFKGRFEGRPIYSYNQLQTRGAYNPDLLKDHTDQTLQAATT